MAERQNRYKSKVKKQILKSMTQFSGASILLMATGFVTSLVSARILDPSVYGLWIALSLIPLYAVYLQVGLGDGMYREIPILRGKGEFEKITIAREVVFSFIFPSVLIVPTIIILVSFFLHFAPPTRLGLRFISAIVFLEFIAGYCGTVLKCENKFKHLSIAGTLRATASMGIIPLVLRYGFVGFLSGQLLAALVYTLYVWRVSGCAFHFNWNLRVFTHLFRSGFPIMLQGLASTLFLTADRIVIVGLLSLTELGFYGIGRRVSGLLSLVIFGPVIYPRLGEDFGRTGDPRDLKKYIVLPSTILSLVFPVLAGAMYLALPMFIETLLPAYTPGIQAARILLFARVFALFAGMSPYLLITIGRQKLLLFLTLLTSSCNLGFMYLFVRIGWGIEGVATGMLAVSFLGTVALLFLAMNYCEASKSESASFIFRLFCPAAYTLLIVLTLDKVIPWGTFVGESALTLLFKESVLLVATGWLLALAVKKLSLSWPGKLPVFAQHPKQDERVPL